MGCFVFAVPVKEGNAQRDDFITKPMRHQGMPELMQEDDPEIGSDRDHRMDGTAKGHERQ
jgi:hypothetical protein